MKKVFGLLLAFLLLAAACGPAATPVPQATAVPTAKPMETEAQPAATAVAQPAATHALEPTTAPAEKPTEPPPQPTAAPEPKRLTLADWAWIVAGWAVETGDGNCMTRWGILETLIKVDFDGNMQPNLATAWVQVDETSWELTLREGVTFQNGEPFNAQAVVNALTYLLGVDTPPKGFGPNNIASVEAKGDYAVVIKTTAPDTLLPNRLVAPPTGILAPSAYKGDGTIDPFGTGTGPFALMDVVPDQSLTLVKNENYWGGKVNLDKVTVLHIPDGDMRSTMLQTGEVDLARSLPIAQIPILENDPNVVMVRSYQPRTLTLYLNNTQGPLSDVRLRRAVQHAINKQAIADAVFEGGAIPAAGPFESTAAWFNPDLSADTYDLEQAIQLLADAGYEKGELKLRLWSYPLRSELPPATIAIQAMLNKAGIEAEVRIGNYDALLAEVKAGEFDMFLLSRGHLLDVFDASGFFGSDYGCTGSFNLGGFCNEQVEALSAGASTMTDVAARFEIYRQIQGILSDEVASVFLVHPMEPEGYRTNVLNYRTHLMVHYVLTPDLDVAQ